MAKVSWNSTFLLKASLSISILGKHSAICAYAVTIRSRASTKSDATCISHVLYQRIDVHGVGSIAKHYLPSELTLWEPKSRADMACHCTTLQLTVSNVPTLGIKASGGACFWVFSWRPVGSQYQVLLFGRLPRWCSGNLLPLAVTRSAEAPRRLREWYVDREERLDQFWKAFCWLYE